MATAACLERDGTGTYARMVVTWEADATGACELELDGIRAPLLPGRPCVLKTFPSVSNAAGAYNLTVKDIRDVDILRASGAGRNETAAEGPVYLYTALTVEVPVRFFTEGPLWFRIDSAGAGAAGTAIIECSLQRVDWY